MSDGKQNEEIDTRIGKANTVLRELSNTAKLSVFKPRSLFRSLHMVMNLGI